MDNSQLTTRQVEAFRIGDVLRTAFSIYVRHLPLFYLIGVIGMLPVPILGELVAAQGWAADVLDLSLIYLLGTWLQATLAYGTVRILRGGAASTQEMLRRSVLAYPRALVVSTLAGAAIAAGLLLFIVPGLALAAMFWIVIPVVVVEGRLFAALRRCYDLTLDHKWPIFGLFAFFYLLLGLALAEGVYPLFNSLASGPYLMCLVDAGVEGFHAVTMAVVYHDLRVLKEGPGSSLARIFD